MGLTENWKQSPHFRILKAPKNELLALLIISKSIEHSHRDHLTHNNSVRKMYSRIIVPLASSPAKYLQQFSPEPLPFTNFAFGKGTDGDGIPEIYITDGKMDYPTEHHVNLHKASNFLSDLPPFLDALGPSSPLDRSTRSLLLSQAASFSAVLPRNLSRFYAPWEISLKTSALSTCNSWTERSVNGRNPIQA